MIPAPNAFVEGLCYLLSAEDEARLDRSEGVPTAYQKKWTEVDFYPAAVKLLGRKVTEILRFDLMGRDAWLPAGHSRVPQVAGGDMAPQYRAQDPVEYIRPVKEVTEITYFRRDGRTQSIEQTGSSQRRGQSVPAGNRNPIEGRVPSNLAGGNLGEPARVLVYLSQNHIKEGLPWDEYVERMNWGIIDAVDLGVSQQYIDNAIAPFLARATGFHANGELRARGVREKKKRSRHVALKKHRRNDEADSRSDQYREQHVLQDEHMNWETTQETHHEYHEYQGS